MGVPVLVHIETGKKSIDLTFSERNDRRQLLCRRRGKTGHAPTLVHPVTRRQPYCRFPAATTDNAFELTSREPDCSYAKSSVLARRCKRIDPDDLNGMAELMDQLNPVFDDGSL
jgi:hypothetical protein